MDGIKKKQQVNNLNDDDDEDMSDEEGGIRVDGIYIPPPPKPYCSVENKGPRLMITKISNNFFKSYADTEVLGPFHKCFNSIVGPNGSGKSNVIDSMLFVFGYRAAKIRCKKISVLLHNSENYRNVQSCSVAVHFALIIDKEGDDYEIVPGSEFVVSRTAHRDNSSYYTVNGKKTHFKEVATLLKQHGIDLNYNRFLILQGEVEQISMMAPKGTEQEPGMLEYLEDIIGTTRYKIPLALLAEKLEQLSELRSEKLNRLKLVEHELNELQAPMEEAVQFLQLENKIVTTKNLLFQKHIFVCEEDGEELKEKLASAEQAVTEINEEIKLLEDNKKEVAKELKEVGAKYESLEKRKEELNESFERANNKDINMQAEMIQINNKRKKMKEQRNQEIKSLETLRKIPKEAPNEILEHEKVEKNLLVQKEAAEEKKVKLLASLKEETKDLLARKDEIQAQLVNLNKSVYAAKAEFTDAESHLKMYQRNHDQESTKLEQLKTQYADLKTRIDNYKQEIEELNKTIPDREKQLKQHNVENLELTNSIAKVSDKIRTQRAQVEEVRSSMQSSRSRSKVLDALMQKKNEGQCPGLFGRLGDLGAIDSKYDVAVSTACGQLDNIVVDTVNTAQWCIEFLKKHDIGRATIIALDKQEHLRKYAEKQIQTPENVPRLFDLIRIPDERVSTAFYYALRDTLVADNLEQGSRIAYGARRYRVVTLSGDLIETTGTMSGGGKKVSRGRMGQSVATNVSADELRNMDNVLHESEEKLRQMRTRKGNLETSMNTLSTEQNQMKINLEKNKIELQSLNQQLVHIKSKLQQQEDAVSSIYLDPKEIKKLTNTVNMKKASYEKELANTSDLEKEMTQVTAEIKQRMHGKVDKLDKNIKEFTKNAEKAKNEISRLRVALTNSDKKIKQSEEKISNIERDITNSENKLREMKAQRDEIEEDGKKFLQLIEEISEKLASGDQNYNDLKAEVAILTKEENKKKVEKIDRDQKFKVIQDKVNEIHAKIHHWKAKISHLKYQDIPNETTPAITTYTKEDLNGKELQTIQRELQAYEEEFKAAKPNLNAILEYRKKQNVYIDRSREVEEVTERRSKMREHHDGLVLRRKDEFITGYNIIKMKLKEMYQMITLGGDADFEMLDTFDPFNEGIQFRVRPPKKTWKIISNLSGGEKTLSSLALVFALHYYKPSPLYVMDEIDAALDFKNVSIVGNYIKERTKNAQFIIISLRSNMFELTNYLIGIYKVFNCTKSVTIDPRKFKETDEVADKPIDNGNENDKENHVEENAITEVGDTLRTS